MIVLIGKSCSGKDTIKKELLNRGFNSIVTYTDRPKRKNETNGITYNFVSSDEFLKKIIDKFFAEFTCYKVKNDEVWHYGTSLQDLKKATDNTVIILNPEGFRTIKNIKGLNIVSFYIDTKKSVIKKRLKRRGDNRKEAKRRMKADNFDFENIEKDVNFIVSNNRNYDIDNVVQIIQYFYNKTKGENT